MKIKSTLPLKTQKKILPLEDRGTPHFTRTMLYSGTFWLVILLMIAGIVLINGRNFYDWTRNKGMITHHKGQLGDLVYVFKDMKNSFIKFPKTWMNAKGGEIPQLRMDIKFKHYEKLAKKREEAFKRGILIQGEDDFVPAMITWNGNPVKVEIRLKGDALDHLRSDKWSFRVKVKGKDHILGMRRFSLQHPKTRRMQGQPLFYTLCRELGILTPRYLFVDFVFNGDKKGIMALEEHFAKELLESQGRKANTIFRMDEDDRWAIKDLNELDNRFYNFRNVKLDPFQGSKVYEDEALASSYKLAVGLVRGVIHQKVKPSEVLDPLLWGRFLALSDTWGTEHGLSWANWRLYYNPISGKIEPIAHDSDAYYIMKNSYRPAFSRDMSRVMLEDPEIYRVYDETLKLLDTRFKKEGLLDKIIEKENEYFNILGKEFFFIERLGVENLAWRVECLLGTNNCGNYKLYPQAIRGFVVESKENLYLELTNPVQYAAQVKKLEWFHPESGKSAPAKVVSEDIFPVELEPTVFLNVPKVYKVRLLNDMRKDGYQIRMWANFKGNESFGPIMANSGLYSLPLSKNAIPTSTLEKQLARHRFLEVDTKSRMFRAKRGTWSVDRSIILPKGYGLEIPAGTTLMFKKGKMALVYGPVAFKGTQAAPIVLQGQKGQTWDGIAVMEAGRSSTWSHVQVRDTSGIQTRQWALTGGVNFFKSDVQIDHSSFTGSMGEDALNIIHSKFRLEEIQVVNTLSDAFDSDFSTGTVVGGSFRNIGTAGGGDAIDVSGTTITVDGTRFEDVTDKALSVGEGSNMIAKNVKMRNISVGGASKDGSSLNISDSTIQQASTAALMAYIKKPEYGGGLIDAKGLTILDTGSRAKAQMGNSIVIDGETVEAMDLDVKALYKTIMKPGLRK